MLIRQWLLVSLFLGLSLSSHLASANLQEQCCVKLFNGEFLPLTCGQYLEGSVLTLPERIYMGLPSPQGCGAMDMNLFMMEPTFPFPPHGDPMFFPAMVGLIF